MAVGPSQAPIIPMETASSCGKPSAKARSSVRKIPNWPAAPRRNVDGWAGPAEIRHRADADEDQQREEFRVDAGVIDGPDEPLLGS